jgi:uncharacterized SAM-binding protein YcdF (DUF218 family)
MKANHQVLFDFLSVKDTPQKADVIIGFGHFDMNIPDRCCKLYLQGYGKKIIFTGGVGAGSTGLKNAEAIEFFNYSRKNFPTIPAADIITEDKSTHTGENLAFTLQKMKEISPEFNFENGISSAILVATPARQLRVHLTARLYLEHLKLLNLPPETTLSQNIELYEGMQESFTKQLTGETDRLIKYPAKGLCEFVNIPADVIRAYHDLKSGL